MFNIMLSFAPSNADLAIIVLSVFIILIYGVFFYSKIEEKLEEVEKKSGLIQNNPSYSSLFHVHIFIIAVILLVMITIINRYFR